MKMHSIVFVFLLVFIASCSSDFSPSVSVNEKVLLTKTIAKLEGIGDIPVLDRSDSLVGPDLDNNGIRDDIDAYIEQHFELEDQKKAARQWARVLQSRMDMDIEDMSQVRNSSLSSGLAISCIYKRFAKGSKYRPTDVVQNMISITYNTKARLKAYLAYDKKLDGTSSSLPRGDVCDRDA